MPKELPGFYYDEEKKRYFPIKGPIPGSSRKPKPPPPPQEPSITHQSRVITSKLLQGREVNGNVVPFGKRKYNFIEEFHKLQASQPTVWKYLPTKDIGDSALAHVEMDLQTAEGLNQMDALITGSTSGLLSYFEVGKVGQHFDDGIKCNPDRVCNNSHRECGEDPGDIRRPRGPSSSILSSSITCIKSFGHRTKRALFTTLGSETSGGSVCTFILEVQPGISEVASVKCSVWTCDYNSEKAIIGTDSGAALVNIDTGAISWVCRSKSAVLAQQFDESGNTVLCGLRNGAILTVDVREKSGGVSGRLTRHRLPHSSLINHGQTSGKQWFKLEGNIYPSLTIFMPSAVCSLVSLKSYDNYFFASSLDGSVKLYDHRMTKRGSVQSYEGHVNSHTHLQLGVDWSERFLVAGGQDCVLRLWSIKSGELLFEERPSTSTPLAACCSIPTDSMRMTGDVCLFRQDHGLWFGSREGIFYI